MHSTDILHGEDSEGFTVHHNGDYSGDLKIMLAASPGGGDLCHPRCPHGHHPVRGDG